MRLFLCLLEPNRLELNLLVADAHYRVFTRIYEVSVGLFLFGPEDVDRNKQILYECGIGEIGYVKKYQGMDQVTKGNIANN